MSEATALVQLQDVDLQLMRIKSQLAAMPQQAKLQTIARAKRKLASQLKQVIGQRKDVETELAENERAHDETTAKIDGVKAEVAERTDSYRRVQDLEAHLTALAKRQEKIEFKHEDIMARLEHLQKAEASARAVGERLLAEERATKESYDAATGELRKQAQILSREREALVAKLEPETLARYDAAAKRFGGLAVEELRSNVPTICRVKLQPAHFSKVVRSQRINECPYCHRILVIQEIGS